MRKKVVIPAVVPLTSGGLSLPMSTLEWDVSRNPAALNKSPWTPAVAGVTAVGLLCTCLWASSSQLKEGNRLFRNGNYEQALNAYNDALIDHPYDSVLHFNAGGAAYQMGDFAKAEKEFQEAGQAAKALLKSAAHYNRGNALFRQNKWDEAIDAYKESLRVNPKDEDAKYNLGLAMKVKQNPAMCPNPKSGSSGEKKDKGSAGPANGGEQKKPGHMSKEDAERLLAAAAAGEKKKGNQKFPKGDAPRPDEDW